MTQRALPVNSLDEALHQFVLWTGMKILRPLHKSGKKVAAVFQAPFSTIKFCVTFKREWYRNFGFDFPQAPDRGWGQITSLNLLKYCEQEGIAYLVAVMPEGRAYQIRVTEFLRYYHEYATDVSRTPGKAHLKGEVAVPIRMWTRLYPAGQQKL